MARPTLLDAGIVHPTGKARAVGWPVWRFPVQVEIDAVLGGELDLFELAVLQLIDLGIVAVSELAADLGLQPALVALVRSRLREKGMLLGGALTADARRALEDDAAREPVTVSGWVLVDAITGRLWPRFAQVLWPVEQRRSDDGRPELVDRHGDVRRAPHLLRAVRREPPPPPVVSHMRDTLRIASFADAGPDPVTFSLRSAPSVVGDSSLVHILTYAFVDAGVRRLLEPCGPGEAPDLEDALDELADVPRFLRRLQTDGDEVEVEALRAAEQRLQQECLRRLVDERGLDPAQESTRRLAEARASRRLGKEQAALVELYRGLETILRAACPAHERRRLRERLPDRPDDVLELLEEAASSCGFARQAPAGLAYAVVEGWSWGSARACAALLVLAGAEDERHPLRRLALADAAEEHARDPEMTRTAWLVDVDDVVAIRNPRAHGAEPDAAPLAVVGEDRIDRQFRLVEITAQHLMRTT